MTIVVDFVTISGKPGWVSCDAMRALHEVVQCKGTAPYSLLVLGGFSGVFFARGVFFWRAQTARHAM